MGHILGEMDFKGNIFCLLDLFCINHMMDDSYRYGNKQKILDSKYKHHMIYVED